MKCVRFFETDVTTFLTGSAIQPGETPENTKIKKGHKLEIKIKHTSKTLV